MPKIIKSKLVNLIPTKDLPCGCSKMWIRLSFMDAEKLDLPTIKMCLKRHYMPPYFVHDNLGDYYAPKTVCKDGCDGKFIYFCTKCKNIEGIELK